MKIRNLLWLPLVVACGSTPVASFIDGGALVVDGGAATDGGSPDGGSPAPDGGRADGGTPRDGGGPMDGGMACNTPQTCPQPTSQCLRATCDQGTCGTAPRADFRACDDADATTWGDVCLQGTCSGLFQSHLFAPEIPAGTVTAARFDGIHCDDNASGAYAVGGFLTSFSTSAVGMIVRVRRGSTPGPSFSWWGAGVARLRSIHSVGGGYVAVGDNRQIAWFDEISQNQDTGVSQRQLGVAAVENYRGVFGWAGTGAGGPELYIAGNMSFVRRCPYPPQFPSCDTQIPVEGDVFGAAITGAVATVGISAWMASPGGDLLYYPVDRSGTPTFVRSGAAQACNSGQPPCVGVDEPTDIFAAGPGAVWATAGNLLSHFDGSQWRVVETPASARANRTFRTAFGGAMASGPQALHLFAEELPEGAQGSGVFTYYLRRGTQWVGPIILKEFPRTQATQHKLDRARGCSANEPLVVGSSADPQTDQQRALVLTPIHQLF